VPVESTIYHSVDSNGFDEKYLQTKQERMNHDMGLRVFVGTMSDTKNAYIKTILSKKTKYDKITAVDVSSGVSDQPFDDEVESGAKNRAKRAYDLNDCVAAKKIGLGLEGGLLNFKDGLYMICVSALYDGEKFFIGKSNPIKLPQEVSRSVYQKKQFGEEIRKYKANDCERETIEELISREKSFIHSLNDAIDQYLV
jgi:non-canonical (house-cleaning) NTP pyrophosphatase